MGTDSGHLMWVTGTAGMGDFAIPTRKFKCTTLVVFTSGPSCMIFSTAVLRENGENMFRSGSILESSVSCKFIPIVTPQPWSMVLLVPGCLAKSGPTAEHTQCHLLLKSWFMIIRMLCLPLPGLCPGDGGVVTGCLV